MKVTKALIKKMYGKELKALNSVAKVYQDIDGIREDKSHIAIKELFENSCYNEVYQTVSNRTSKIIDMVEGNGGHYQHITDLIRTEYKAVKFCWLYV